MDPDAEVDAPTSESVAACSCHPNRSAAVCRLHGGFLCDTSDAYMGGCLLADPPVELREMSNTVNQDVHAWSSSGASDYPGCRWAAYCSPRLNASHAGIYSVQPWPDSFMSIKTLQLASAEPQGLRSSEGPVRGGTRQLRNEVVNTTTTQLIKGGD